MAVAAWRCFVFRLWKRRLNLRLDLHHHRHHYIFSLYSCCFKNNKAQRISLFQSRALLWLFCSWRVFICVFILSFATFIGIVCFDMAEWVALATSVQSLCNGVVLNTKKVHLLVPRLNVVLRLTPCWWGSPTPSRRAFAWLTGLHPFVPIESFV